VLKYTVGDRDVLESPWIEQAGGHPVFTRTFQIGPSGKSSRVVICSAAGAYDLVKREVDGLAIYKMGIHSGEGLAVTMIGDPGEMQFKDLTRLELTIPASDSPTKFKIFLSKMHHQHLKVLASLANASQTEDLERWTKGGSSHWPQTIETKGERAADSDAACAVDTLTLPHDNPWNSLMHVSGHDFFANGDAAVCMSHGDVWVLRGIDATLGKLRWKRFATGVSSPLGLKIVNDVIHVTCHDQITRLHDLNSDGEADYYENFNNDCQVTKSHHRFATDLETDAQGNFYYKKCIEEGSSDHGGSMIRVSPDGKQFEIIATGLRNPNGMAVSPTGVITYGKQQGGWIPSSGIQVVKPGSFCGYLPAHHRKSAPDTFDHPMCWIPHGVDNSCGGQAWAPTENNRWGPLSGNLLHFSYGKCRMFVVPHQVVGDVYQGAVVPLPGITFRSSAMRARFRPTDGQLYVSGLRGWQTSAEYSGALHRVRYTGKPLYLATGYAIESNGIRIGFTQPLDTKTAGDPKNYQIHQWNYRWTKSYGSRDYKVSDPEKEGRDPVEIADVELSDDGRGVLLKIPNLQPVMQIQIEADLKAADGKPLHAELYGTINVVP
jgi:hypothetical protein